MIEAMSKEYPIRELCAVLEVTRSGYTHGVADVKRPVS